MRILSENCKTEIIIPCSDGVGVFRLLLNDHVVCCLCELVQLYGGSTRPDVNNVIPRISNR